MLEKVIVKFAVRAVMSVFERTGQHLIEANSFLPRVSLEDLYNGKTTKLQLSKNVLCSACSG